MITLSCTACRAPFENSEVEGTQPSSLAGAGTSETTKAVASTTERELRTESLPAVSPFGRWQSHLEYCADGFQTTGDTRVDLARLGALCGPSNGLVRGLGSVLEFASDESELLRGELRLPAAQSAECGRFVVAFSRRDAAQSLTVSVHGRNGTVDECTLNQSGFCPSDELSCRVEKVTFRVASEIDDAEERTSTPTQASFEVNVEWWSLPGVSSPPRTTASQVETRALPSVQ